VLLTAIAIIDEHHAGVDDVCPNRRLPRRCVSTSARASPLSRARIRWPGGSHSSESVTWAA
jgi:hypothetical protein